ncbi:MAG TPA: Ldh family oxidoreductase [Solirubrobacteraceae bacterium]|nr:Ldh family oxidoreductase [Solirubrobacteraceae bacterium]
MVALGLDEARGLCEAAAHRLGLREADAEIVAEHLLDAEMRGAVGLSRLLVLADDMARYGRYRDAEIEVVRETDRSAVVRGGGRVGMVVALEATRIAIAKAKAHGTAVVAADEHMYSGLLAHYAETAAREDLVAIVVAAGGVRRGLPRIAPFGAREGRFTTNPIAVGLPTSGDPVVWDVSTAAVSGGELFERMETGTPLDEGVAVGPDGLPTTDPCAAVAGTVLAWGGHRGSGLMVCIQLLGMLSGLPPLPTDADGTAFLVVAIDPARLGGLDDFKARAAAFADGIRTSTPVDGVEEVRMPYDRSLRERSRAMREGRVRIPEAVHRRLRAVASEGLAAAGAEAGR